ncbi:MAG: histidine phosphatase family protein [Bacillota bacterium]
MEIVFIRHGESEKNIRNITGGEGEPLTSLGKEQAMLIARGELKKFIVGSETKFISSDFKQTIQTLSIIAQEFGREITIAEELVSAGMGVIAGLSHKDIDELYPECATRLKQWRKTEIEAIDLNIPGMESPIAFYDRIMEYIMTLPGDFRYVICCTRSIMVLMANVLLKNSPYPGGGYHHVQIKNCDLIAMDICRDANDEISFSNMNEYITVNEVKGNHGR